MAFISIDPGKNYFGWAEWDSGVLYRCGVERDVDSDPVNVWTLDRLPLAFTVLERMVQRGKFSREKVADLIAVTETGNYIAGQLRVPVVRQAPAEWKGTLPPAQEQARTLSALDEREREVVRGLCAYRGWKLGGGGWASHALSAVGIGLNYLGRYKNTRIDPAILESLKNRRK